MLIDEEHYEHLRGYIGYDDPSDISGSRAEKAARKFSIALRKGIEIEDWGAMSRLAEDVCSSEEIERHYFYEQGGTEVHEETLKIVASKIPEIDAFASSINELKGALRMAVYFDELVKYPEQHGNVMVVFGSNENIVCEHVDVGMEMMKRDWHGAYNVGKIAEYPEWEDMYYGDTILGSAAAVRYEMKDGKWKRLDKGILIT